MLSFQEYPFQHSRKKMHGKTSTCISSHTACAEKRQLLFWKTNKKLLGNSCFDITCKSCLNISCKSYFDISCKSWYLLICKIQKSVLQPWVSPVICLWSNMNERKTEKIKYFQMQCNPTKDHLLQRIFVHMNLHLRSCASAFLFMRIKMTCFNAKQCSSKVSAWIYKCDVWYFCCVLIYPYKEF